MISAMENLSEEECVKLLLQIPTPGSRKLGDKICRTIYHLYHSLSHDEVPLEWPAPPGKKKKAGKSGGDGGGGGSAAAAGGNEEEDLWNASQGSL